MNNYLTNSKDMLTCGMISRFPGSKFPQTSSRRICLTSACPAFSSSFFSQPYDLPLPQRLSFDNDLNCPYRGRPHHMSRVSPVFATLTKTTGVYPNSSQNGTRHWVSQLISFALSLSLAKASGRVASFQSLAHSLSKNSGVYFFSHCIFTSLLHFFAPFKLSKIPVSALPQLQWDFSKGH